MNAADRRPELFILPHYLHDFRILENRHVKLHCLSGFAIKPQEWGYSFHLVSPLVGVCLFFRQEIGELNQSAGPILPHAFVRGFKGFASIIKLDS